MNGMVRTRFPPEPNGYLHIGHAKSMYMNFKLAFDKLGVPEDKRETIFRLGMFACLLVLCRVPIALVNHHELFFALALTEPHHTALPSSDDTNPEAESKEYIDSITEDVAWLGWKPLKRTHASDLMDTFYELAIKLIKKGKAYVCHQTKEEIEKSRDMCKDRLAGKPIDGKCVLCALA